MLHTIQEPALVAFCRQVRARSMEHEKSLALNLDHGLYGQVISILRQEIDSLIRVAWLKSVSNDQEREQLATMATKHEPWKWANGKRITDKEMLDQIGPSTYWEAVVYRLGCSFVHLSGFHDHKARDPLALLSREDLDLILDYIESYHNIRVQADFVSILSVTPQILHKIVENIDHYLKEIEEVAS